MKRHVWALFLLPLCALADGGLPVQPYIYVEGRAEIEKPADMVTLRFTFTALNPDQVAANKKVQTQAANVFKLLETTKIAANDVVASDFKVESQYSGSDDSSARTRGKLLGYVVSRPFEVKVREVEKFPKLVNDLLALGVTEFQSIVEGLGDSKVFTDQVWEKAVANARERAEKTAKAAGMKIDSVFAMSPVAFPEIRKAMLGDTEGVAYAVGMGPTDAKLDPSQYRLAPVRVSQSVHVIYLISPEK